MEAILKFLIFLSCTLLLLLVCMLIDIGFGYNKTTVATIGTKTFVKSHRTTSMVYSGPTIVPISRHHPAKYVFTFVDSELVATNDETSGKKYNIGQKVQVLSTFGMSGIYYESTIIGSDNH